MMNHMKPGRLLFISAAQPGDTTSCRSKLHATAVLFLFISSLFCIQACAPKNNILSVQQTTPELKPYVLKYERGPCFGKCPVYSFYLLSDHTAIVNAKANLMDTAGWYFTPLDQEGLVEILELIEPSEWWLQDLNNQPEIADLPISSLVYHHPQGVRSISIQSRTSESLEKVFGKLSHLVTESSWVPTQLRPLESNAEPTDVIVQLKENIDIQSWMKKFDRFGIKLIKRLTPRQHYYLVSKDPAKGNANDFLQYIKSDPDVVDAQWDRKLDRRFD